MIRAAWPVTGLVFLLVGLYGAVRPDETARFTEQVDALGSKHDVGSVEPTDWNVRLTRLVSLFSTLCGVATVGLAFAPPRASRERDFRSLLLTDRSVSM